MAGYMLQAGARICKVCLSNYLSHYREVLPEWCPAQVHSAFALRIRRGVEDAWRTALSWHLMHRCIQMQLPKVACFDRADTHVT